MKRTITCLAALSLATAAGCEGGGPEPEDVESVEQAINPPYCDGGCGPIRPDEKECRLADESRTTCGAWRRGEVIDTPPPKCETSKPTFSAPFSAAVDQEVKFKADTSNIVNAMNWSFGDTTHCEQCGRKVFHAYTSTGWYQVVLTATMVGSKGSEVCYETRLSDPVWIYISPFPNPPGVTSYFVFPCDRSRIS